MVNINITLSDGQITRTSVDGSKTVGEVIKTCVDKDCDDYALVFFGRKLKPEQKLQDIQHINANEARHSPYLIRQRKNAVVSALEGAEVEKLLTGCRTKYKQLIEEAHPQVSAEVYQQLLEYMVENDGANFNSTMKEYPAIFYDTKGMDVLKDFRLMIQFIIQDDHFAHKHPTCLLVFKKALDHVANKVESPSYFLPGPSFRQNQPLQQAQNQPTITQQMLNQALSIAFTGGDAAGQTASNTTPPTLAAANPPPLQVPTRQLEPVSQQPATDASQQYGVQLQQMHEFGFLDDAENIQALILTNGDVEQALQIVIAMRE